MYDYELTGRPETDKCIALANKAYKYYFKNPIVYAKEFAITAKDFFKAFEEKICSRENEIKFNDALKKHFTRDGYFNESKYEYFFTELRANRIRLNTIIDKSSLINNDTVFILEYVARFIEIIIRYLSDDVRDLVDKNRKFNLKGIADVELTFFKFPKNINNIKNNYLYAFYINAWSAQKNLNGFTFMKNYLKLHNPHVLYDSYVEQFFDSYGVGDSFSSLIFARMANEQYLKYLSSKTDEFWNHVYSSLNNKMRDEVKFAIVQRRNNDDKDISIPTRIKALSKAGVFNELISIELELVNSRGNNIVHQGFPGFYASCYHNLQVLNYLYRNCK